MQTNIPIEQIVPVLHPGSLEPGDPRACRPLFPGDDCEVVQVCYAVVGEDVNQYVTWEFLQQDGIDIATLEQHAVNNWVRDNQTFDWQDVSPDGNGRVMGADGPETMAAILLSAGHLKGMHRHFDSEIIYVVVPSVFTVLFAPDPIHVLPLGARVYEGETALSAASPECMPTGFLPCAFVSHNGSVSGTCALQPDGNAAAGPSGEGGARDPLADSEIVVCTVMAAILAADGRPPSRKTMVKTIQLLAEIAVTPGLAGESARAIISKDGEPLRDAYRSASMGMVILSIHLTSVRNHLGENLYQEYASTLLKLAESLSKLERGLFGPKVSAKKKEALHWIGSLLFAREEEE